ncbi:phosphatase PAP2 family protein [Nocardioides donggukensis]|uniref:Inositol phosphorylceramide synthase n=1 Tax=Nocardioides donggukensis TaxID=2774019 RepID=A0A927K2L3_9ACTN|nr:phosphatase PAP2 family protein [Nocardioides donggukensis]MBD8868521.1 inositol phosphorylceramide synthase [Nocardioides donggukensis]
MGKRGAEGAPAVREVGSPVAITRTGPRIAAVSGYLVLLVAWTLAWGVPSDTVQIFGWLWLATVCWHVEAPPGHHLGFLRDWWPPVAALVVYFYSRGLADELGFTPEVTMPIAVDTWLGGGELPSYRLQTALCGQPCVGSGGARWYDVLFTSVYTTHFVAGLALAMVLWLTRRVEWRRWMRRYVAANLAALVVYVLYPMAPPWMASRDGYLTHEVLRITDRGWGDTDLARFHLVLTGVGNPVAAMPSLHAGIAFLLALYGIQRLRGPWRWALLAYPLTMSLGLVYSGEHYVVDIVAGAVLAVGVLGACSWWERIRGD